MDVFSQAANSLEQQRYQITQFQQQQVTEYEEDLQNAISLIDQLINSLQQLSALIPQLNTDAQPDITYRIHAAIVVGCEQFLLEQAQYIKTRFPGYNFITPTRIQQLIPSYLQVNEILIAIQNAQQSKVQNGQSGKTSIFKQIFKKINFLDGRLLRQKNVNNMQVMPPQPEKTFQRLVTSDISLEAANKRMYPQAIHIGRGLPIRPGKQVPYIQDEEMEQNNPIQIIRTAEGSDIQIHFVAGYLFIQGNSEQQQVVQLTKYQQYLRLAKLCAAIKPDGTLGKPYAKAKQEHLVALNALSEIISIESRDDKLQLEGAGNVPQVPAHPQTPQKYKMLSDNQNMIDALSKLLLKCPQLQNDLRFSEVLQDAKAKCEHYFECCANIRKAAYLIHKSISDIPKELEFTIQEKMLSNEEEIKYKNEMYSQITQLISLEKSLLLFEKSQELRKKLVRVENGKQPDVSKIQIELEKLSAEIDSQQDTKDQNYQNQLYIDEQLPTSFIVSFGGVTGPNVKVQLLVNGHAQATSQVSFQEVTKVQGDQLGTDLSTLPTGGINYFVTMKQLPNVLIRLTIGRKTFNLKIPLRLGEYTTALDTTVDGLELTLGYFIRVRGGGYEPNKDEKKQQYGYDPNLRYRLTHDKPKQDVGECQGKDQARPSDTIRSVKIYKGGSYAQFVQAMKTHYELDNQSKDVYDAKNYINLLQTRRGPSMQILEARRVPYGSYKRKTQEGPRFALEDVWRGPNNEPLFFNQYLSSIRLLYQSLEGQNQSFRQELQMLWTDRKWVNPFLPPAVRWSGRPTYPVQLNATQAGRDMYQRYKDQFEDYDVSESDDDVTTTQGQQMEWERNENSLEAELGLLGGEKVVHGLTKMPYVQIVLRVDTMFLLPEEDCTAATSFFFAAKISGSGMQSFNTYERQKQGKRGVVYFAETVYLDVPLPEIVVLDNDSAAGTVVGYELTDASLSSLPYALRLNVYRCDKAMQSTSLVGGTTIPLRTVFLAGGLRGDVGLNQAISVRLAVEFSPTRVPLNPTPELYNSCSNTSLFRGNLPDGFDVFWRDVETTPTRIGGAGSSGSVAGSLNSLNYRERDALLSLDQKQRKKYISAYTRRLFWWERGVTLFCKACTGEWRFVNDFVMTEGQARELRQFLGLKGCADCARFAASVPFVPGAVSRYYVQSRFGRVADEVRLTFDEVLRLSGGDYFEHACLLQAVLKACGEAAYVARGCSQTLVNEYFVVVLRGFSYEGAIEGSGITKQRQVLAIDPVSGAGYLLWGEGVEQTTNINLHYKKQTTGVEQTAGVGNSSVENDVGGSAQITLQRYYTKVSMLFNAEALYVNLQPELHPAFTDFDLNNSFAWATLNHHSTHPDVPLHLHFFSDMEVGMEGSERNGEIGQLEQMRSLEIVQTVKDFISQYETRRGTLTRFNDELATRFQNNEAEVMKSYETLKITVESAYEDSASLLEKLENAAVTEVADPLAECLVICDLKAFGLKFAHVRLDVVWARKGGSGGAGSQRFLQQKGNYSIWV